MTTPEINVQETTVQGNHGPTAVGVHVGRDLTQQVITQVRGRPALYLSEIEINDRVNSYVAAGNHDLIEKTLRSRRILTLTGLPGSGRTTIALATLRHLEPGMRIRKLALDDEEELGDLHCKAPTGHLLHLPADDSHLSSRLLTCVEQIRSLVGSYLVIITEPDVGDRRLFLNEIAPIIAVEPSDPLAVYRHRLVIRGIGDERWLDWQEAALLLHRALPGDARRLTEFIEDARRSGDADINAQQIEVTKEYRSWADDLRKWFKDHQGIRVQALKIAGAALASAHFDELYHAADCLTRRLDMPSEGRGLAWHPVTGLDQTLDAHLTAGQLRFRRTHYHTAVIRHVWNEYPLTKADLIEWLTGLPLDDALREEPRAQVARTFTDLAIERGLATELTKAAKAWADAGRADPAFIALAPASLDSRIGGRTRTQLYKWSRTMSISQTLKLTVARVCQVLGQTYLSIALTRLKHLAANGDDEVKQEVIAVADDLADKPERRRHVLAEALRWINPPSFTRSNLPQPGLDLFFHLISRADARGLAVALLDSAPTAPETTTLAWQKALEQQHSNVEQASYLWLNTALHVAHVQQPITNTFITAAMEARTPGHNVMLSLVGRWEAHDINDPERRKIANQIRAPLMERVRGPQPRWLDTLQLLYARLRGRR
jgi:hypothetical protein